VRRTLEHMIQDTK
jgi:dihydroxyacetone kinase